AAKGGLNDTLGRRAISYRDGYSSAPREFSWRPTVDRMRAGEFRRMHQAMLACHDSLFRYARALTRDQADAEELVQECYRRALGAARRPPAADVEQVRRWMFVILRNVWKNDLRARGREDDIEAAGDLPAAKEHSPETILLRSALQFEIRAAL